MYCRDECKDLTCPLPDTPQPSSRQSTLRIVEDEDAPELGMEIEVSPSQVTSSHQLTKKRDNVVFVNNMAITKEHAQTISNIGQPKVPI